ncbi:MAG: aldo/keto reductase [Planctomycetota bacterium]
MSDSNSKISRRKLFTQTSKIAVASAIGAEAMAKTDRAPGQHQHQKKCKSKILNYHPQMKYRKMGKTGLMVSEVSLGGHWKTRKGVDSGCWEKFSKDEVPADVAKNRTEVISAAIDAGINYLDITTNAECLSYGVALKGRRQKMIVGADDARLGPRFFENCSVKRLTHNVEQCLRRLQTDYLDIWRVQARMEGNNTDGHVEIMVETAEKMLKAGKIKHFGVSSHVRNWLQHVIQKWPQVEMVIFPVTAKTKKAKAPLPLAKENIHEEQTFGCRITTSIFDAVRKHNVGLVSIKPFAGGNIFKNKQKFPVMGVGLKEENDLARLTLQCILTLYDQISCAVPGATTIYEVENAARASYMRQLPMTPAEKAWLQQETDQKMANLPPDYQWLRNWDVI